MTKIVAMLSSVPFSAKVGGRELRELVSGWAPQRSAMRFDGGVIERTAWSDNATGLQVILHFRRFDKFLAVDWFVEIANIGQSETPMLEQIQALDATLDVANWRVDLHHANGSLCQMDDFLPQQVE